MVCTRVPNTDTYGRQGATIILIKAWQGFELTVKEEQPTMNKACKRLQHNTGQLAQFVLSQDNSDTNTIQSHSTDTTDKWGNNSSDCTNHNCNTRSRTLSEETTTTGRTTTRNTWQESTRGWEKHYRRTIVTRLDDGDFEHRNKRNESYKDKLGQESHGSSWSLVQHDRNNSSAQNKVDNKSPTRTTLSTSSSTSLNPGQELQRKTTHKTQMDNKPSTGTTSLTSFSTSLHPGQELQRKKSAHKTHMDNKPSTGTTSLTSSSALLHLGKELQRKTTTMPRQKMDSKPSRDRTTWTSASSK